MVATRMVATLFLVGVRIVVPNIPILRTENLESNGEKKIWHFLSKSHARPPRRVLGPSFVTRAGSEVVVPL